MLQGVNLVAQSLVVRDVLYWLDSWLELQICEFVHVFTQNYGLLLMNYRVRWNVSAKLKRIKKL